MPIRIFTLPFSEETQTFHDDLVHQFCRNKRIHRIETKFFTKNNHPFWTVAVHYGAILSEEKPVRVFGVSGDEEGLDEQQKVLLLRLKEWRRETAEAAGMPVFIIASNAHLIGLIRNRCTTLESMKLVKGFGKAKIERYGKSLAALIKTFYEGD